MDTAKVKVLELLADGKISVEDATLLLDAMKQDEASAKVDSEATANRHEEIAKETELNVEDFVREAMQNVTDTVRKGVQTADEQLKKVKENNDDTANPFQQLEKTLQQLTEELKKK